MKFNCDMQRSRGGIKLWRVRRILFGGIPGGKPDALVLMNQGPVLREVAKKTSPN